MQKTVNIDDAQFQPEKSTKPCERAIAKGICNADCCRQVIIPLLRINYEGKKECMFTQPDELLEILDVVYVYRKDMICVYLNQDTNTCQIYDLRPSVCSNYGKKTNCLYYDKFDKVIPINKRKLFDFETREEILKEYSELKNLVLSGHAKEVLVDCKNGLGMAIIRAFATPESFIKALQFLMPDRVVDYEKARRIK